MLVCCQKVAVRITELLLLFTESKHFILSLILIMLSPLSDFFRTSDSMFLSIDTARIINFYDYDFDYYINALFG